MSGIKIGSDSGNGHTPGLYYKESAPAHINPADEANLQKWEEILHLSRKELLAAIELYGNNIRNIRRGLINQKSEDEAA